MVCTSFCLSCIFLFSLISSLSLSLSYLSLSLSLSLCLSVSLTLSPPFLSLSLSVSLTLYLSLSLSLSLSLPFSNYLHSLKTAPVSNLKLVAFLGWMDATEGVPHIGKAINLKPVPWQTDCRLIAEEPPLSNTCLL